MTISLLHGIIPKLLINWWMESWTNNFVKSRPGPWSLLGFCKIKAIFQFQSKHFAFCSKIVSVGSDLAEPPDSIFIVFLGKKVLSIVQYYQVISVSLASDPQYTQSVLSLLCSGIFRGDFWLKTFQSFISRLKPDLGLLLADLAWPA